MSADLIRFVEVFKDRTLIFKNTSNEHFPVIVSGIRDSGEANTLIPVLERLQQRFNLVIFADENGLVSLRKSKLKLDEVQDNPLRVIARLNPNLVLTGVSYDLGISGALNFNGFLDNIPVVAVEDYPGALTQQILKVRDLSNVVLPQYICVANSWAYNEELRYAQDLDPNKVFITGLPNLDKIASEDVEGKRSEVRKLLGVKEGEKLIVWMGQTKLATIQALELLVAGLRSLDGIKYKLVVRKHPRDANPSQRYSQILNYLSDNLVDTTQLSTNDVGQAADFVVTMYSTEGQIAVYRGIPSMHILVPEILENSDGRGVVSVIGPVLDGASMAVYKKDDVTFYLERFFNDTNFNFLLKEKMKNWKVDGKATDKVLAVIDKLMGNRN